MNPHLDPRHPASLAVFYARDLDQARAADPRLASAPVSLVSGPAWLFHNVTLTPEEQRKAALAASASRLTRAQALHLDPPVDLFMAHAAALSNDKPETLARLLETLDQ